MLNRFYENRCCVHPYHSCYFLYIYIFDVNSASFQTNSKVQFTLLVNMREILILKELLGTVDILLCGIGFRSLY